MQYRIEGTPMPVVICRLNRGEAMNCQNGGMCWMTPGMKMETSGGGGLGKALGRMFSGEAIFMNRYEATQDGEIAFAVTAPGEIIPYELGPGHDLIAQKGAYLASEPGVELSVHMKKSLGASFFGGEGFVMQRLSGKGMVFLEIDGSVVSYELQAGQSMVIDTGYLAAMESSCTMEIQKVSGVKNALLGGEGLFNTVVTGPGRIWLQTMPISHLAQAIAHLLPSKS